MADAVIAATRTQTATVVAVCPAERLEETTTALRALQTRSAVRSLAVTFGEDPQPALTEQDGVTVVEGLTPRFLNNLVAARRLSSLPAMAWWRGGDREVFHDLAPLVERLAMDSTDPVEDWRAAAPLVDATSLSDLRWTRLTRWRSLLAQFFDLPVVRAAAGSLDALRVDAADPHAARLFAGWLVSRLPNGRRMAVDIRTGAGPHPVSAVTLSGSTLRLELKTTARGTCVRSSLEGGDHPSVARIVSLGDQSLAALLEQELRVRARDVSFEQALQYAAEAR